MRRTTVPSVLALLLLSVTPVTSAPFWEKKPHPKWSKKECTRILEDSPWAYPYAITGIASPGPMRSDGRSVPDIDVDAIPGGTGDREVHLYLLIRFVTAKPVKAAIGRMRMLAQPDNGGLKQMVEDYVNQPDSDMIAVEVTWYSEPVGHPALLVMQSFFRTATLDTLRSRVYLSCSAKNAYLPLSQYSAPSESQPGALLFFPRYDDAGNSHFQGDEKEMLLRMDTGFGLVELIMKPASMKFDGGFTL